MGLTASAVKKLVTLPRTKANKLAVEKAIIQAAYRQNLINSLREQINRQGFKARDLRLPVNNKELLPIPELSKRAAVYSGVSDKEIFQLFQDLAGISKMPEVRMMENWREIVCK
ncbi:hypothetical protein A4A71_06640 [Nicoletella semolina]|uniref:hypothetical protein n=1 Tax=Nicoletella semolina TaxID=271160 RepID=UPI0010463048|nr:hypothetical protein [Nicoletella semolina]MDH2925002.1 hypothetical protein [Nicoletella semolina]